MLCPGLPVAPPAFLLHPLQLSMPLARMTWSCHSLSPPPNPAWPHLSNLISAPPPLISDNTDSPSFASAWGTHYPYTSPPCICLIPISLPVVSPESPSLLHPTSTLGPSVIRDYPLGLFLLWQRPPGPRQRPRLSHEQPLAQCVASNEQPGAARQITEHTNQRIPVHAAPGPGRIPNWNAPVGPQGGIETSPASEEKGGLLATARNNQIL